MISCYLSPWSTSTQQGIVCQLRRISRPELHRRQERRHRLRLRPRPGLRREACERHHLRLVRRKNFFVGDGVGCQASAVEPDSVGVVRRVVSVHRAHEKAVLRLSKSVKSIIFVKLNKKDPRNINSNFNVYFSNPYYLSYYYLCSTGWSLF